MIKIPVKLLIPLTLISISACSSNQKNELPQGYLATHIFEDGSKQFVYTVNLPESTGRGRRGKGSGRPGNMTGHVQGGSNRSLTGGVTAGSGGSGKGGGSRAGSGQQGRASMLMNALEAELKKSAYCREGYMELERMMEPSQTFIKGECVDAASVNDYEKFPNEIE